MGELIEAPENEALERAIFDGRDDPGAWQVFGDWLKTHGDPRGDAIALSFSGDDDALKELITTHEKRWLGGLYESVERVRARGPDDLKPETSVEWRHGFLHAVRIAGHYEHAPECSLKVEALLALPGVRFLHSLTIGVYDAQGWNTYEGLAELLTDKLPMLRHLYVGDFYEHESMISSSFVPDVDELLRGLPSLRSLVACGNMDARTLLRHDELVSLLLKSGGVGSDMTWAVGGGTFPKLERLELWTGQEQYGGYGPLSDYAPLLSGETCPSLTHLGFRNAEQANDFVNELARSALLPRLSSVDLSMGALTPEGAENLLEHHAKFAHLTSLNVSECCLGEDVVAELAEVFSAEVIIANDQRNGVSFEEWDKACEWGTVDDLQCYTAVGE